MSQFNKILQQERIWMSHIVNYNEIFFTFIFRFRGYVGRFVTWDIMRFGIWYKHSSECQIKA